MSALAPFLIRHKFTRKQILRRLLKYGNHDNWFMTRELAGAQYRLDLVQNNEYKLACGEIDQEELDWVTQNYDPSTPFVDAGANIGFYTIQAGAKLKASKVIAIEADPETRAKLEHNIALNNVSCAIEPVGLSDTNEIKTFRINGTGNRGANSFALPERFHSDKDQLVEMPCKTLWQIMQDNEIQQIGLLKIDIEGFEYPVLKAFVQAVDKVHYPQHILLEAWGHNIEEAGGSAVSLLTEAGYRLRWFKGENFFFSL